VCWKDYICKVSFAGKKVTGKKTMDRNKIHPRRPKGACSNLITRSVHLIVPAVLKHALSDNQARQAVAGRLTRPPRRRPPPDSQRCAGGKRRAGRTTGGPPASFFLNSLNDGGFSSVGHCLAERRARPPPPSSHSVGRRARTRGRGEKPWRRQDADPCSLRGWDMANP
jgi:hypothetical protein